MRQIFPQVFLLIVLSLCNARSSFAEFFAYITNSDSNTVSVIDTATNTVVATVPVGTQAFGVTVNPAGTRVYVTNGEPDNVVTVIDATKLPDNLNDTVMDVIPVGNDPEGIDITPDGNTLYSSALGTVSVIDVANDTNTVIATIFAGGDLVGVVTHPDGTRVYVADGSGRRVRVINTATNTISATIPVGDANNGPNGITINPSGTRVYVEVNNLGLRVIDADPNSPTFHTVIDTIPVGTTPSSVATNQAGTQAYVTNSGSNTMSVINIANDANTVIATVPVGANPRGVAVHPDDTLVYVALNGDNAVAVIDALTNVPVLPPIPVGSGPVAFGKFIGPSSNVPPTLTLAEKAVEIAKSVEGAPYLGDGLTWGGKGWEWVEKRYVDSNETRDGYRFWNNSIEMQDFGAGLDCSGLILWSYNKASRATNYLEGNSIRYPNANGQFLHNTEQINDNELQPGHLLFYDRNQDGYKDHVAMYIGEEQIIEAFGVQTGIQIDQLSNRTKPGTGFVGHFRKVIENPPIGIQVKVSSPVDLIVTDPDGFTITSKTFIQTDLEYAREIPGILYYSEGVSGIDGHPDDVVFAPISKTGDYIIQVAPEPDTLTTDTYSLEIEADGTTILLAQDVLIRDIPTQGYGIEVAESEVIQFIPVLIDIKPGSDPNSINPESEGVISVAILSTTVFDASSVIMIDKNLLTFGHVGDEKSLALRGNGVPNCSGEDINNDGLLDLVCHFSTQETGFKNGDTEGMLTGQTVDGMLIKGTDSVRIVP